MNIIKPPSDNTPVPAMSSRQAGQVPDRSGQVITPFAIQEEKHIISVPIDLLREYL